MLIPKIIHYCWFGKSEKPKLAKKCIESWKKNCPDYQIIEWNEDNYDITSAPLFVQQAIEAKKWAFATDYIRLKVVYDYGGIYLDTDVEVIKNLDPFLDNKAYFGFETKSRVATGLGFGAIPQRRILSELMKAYETTPFIRPDGSLDVLPCPQRDLDTFLFHGLICDGADQILDDGTHIYPQEFFSPCNNLGWVRRTKNTATIHWFTASWHTEEEKKAHAKQVRANRIDYFLHFPNRVGMKLLGKQQYEKLKKKLGK